mgnify:CR=1 FL=1
MKQLLKLTGCLALAGLFASCQSAQQEANYQIIPMPQEIVTAQGNPFILKSGVKILYPEGNEKMQRNAQFLADYLKTATGKDFAIEAGTEGKNAIVLTLGTANENPESYQLKVTGDGITIASPTEAGVFYGIQSLRKSLPVAVGADISMPAVEINDAPRFGYRGAHFDTSRHFFTVDEVKTYIDMMALHNMNRFHWHITEDQGWRLEIKKYPKLTEIGSKRTETVIGRNSGEYDGKPYGGFYTQEQAKEIEAYAAERYITVIPEIDLPGHMQAALAAYPELGCTGGPYEVWRQWGVSEDVLCAGNDQVLKFLEDVYSELIEIFPSEYIHVGGDECPKVRWEKCPKCQARIKALGLKSDGAHSKEERLQSFVINHIEKFLNDHGRQIIGWDEILEGGLAPNATVMSWRGVEGGMNAAKAGHNAIMTPNPYVYLDYYQEEPEIAPTTIGGYNTLKKTYSYNPVPDDADELAKKHIIGIQGNIWREYMQTSERTDYQAFPRAMAIAETAWTQNANKDWKNFCERMVTEFERLEVMNTKPCLNFFDVNVNTHADENAPLMVMLESFYPNAEIRYTTDGSEPSKTSTLYEKPFVLEGNIDLKAAAFKDGKMLGKVAHKPLYGNLLTGKPYTVNYKMGWTGDIFDENDVLGADKTTFGLTNGKRGNNASYTPWCSFGIVEGKDLEFIINLDKPTQISKIIFGSLFNPAMRILPAGGVAVEVSADGKQYTPVAEKALKHDYPETGRIAFTDSIEFEPTQATFLKVKIKNGGTLRNGVNFEKNNGPEVIPAELWIDEIEAY